MSKETGGPAFPDWWPENQYPEDIFTGRIDDIPELIPDEKVRAKVAGALLRYGYNLASEDCFKAMTEHREGEKESVIDNDLVKPFQEEIPEDKYSSFRDAIQHREGEK